MTGQLLKDIWPLKIGEPEEKEPEPEPEIGVRTKLIRDRGKPEKIKKEKPEKKPSGRKDDTVKIISDHGNVLIVEHQATKERFTVQKEDVLIN